MSPSCLMHWNPWWSAVLQSICLLKSLDSQHVFLVPVWESSGVDGSSNLPESYWLVWNCPRCRWKCRFVFLRVYTCPTWCPWDSQQTRINHCSYSVTVLVKKNEWMKTMILNLPVCTIIFNTCSTINWDKSYLNIAYMWGRWEPNKCLEIGIIRMNDHFEYSLTPKMSYKSSRQLEHTSLSLLLELILSCNCIFKIVVTLINCYYTFENETW